MVGAMGWITRTLEKPFKGSFMSVKSFCLRDRGRLKIGTQSRYVDLRYIPKF